ncbi:MAG: hypothetical protein IT384_29570 [Deltaproteobacteria bacterium]|nr:hypothetical protein [Deltaproteobacteria bacterium]
MRAWIGLLVLAAGCTSGVEPLPTGAADATAVGLGDASTSRDAAPTPPDAGAPPPDASSALDAGDAGDTGELGDAGAWDDLATLEDAERYGRAAAQSAASCAGAFSREIGGLENGWPISEAYVFAVYWVGGGRTRVDAGRLAECEAIAADGVCDARDQTCFVFDPPFTGAQSRGGPCFSAIECESRICTSELSCGVCISADEQSDVGGPCAGRIYCRSGLACVAGRCSGGSGGDPCGADSDCAQELSCFSSVCRGPGVQGEPCRFDSHCTSGLACVTQTCQRPSALGAPCQYDHHCETALYCDVPSRSCQPRAAIGESCQAHRCDPSAYCDSTRHCAPRRQEGSTCEGDHACAADLVCVTPGICAERSEVGRFAGAPCIRSSCDFSDLGLVCVGTGLAATCQQAVAVNLGELCDLHAPTLRYCRSAEGSCRDDGTGAARCTPAPALGEACSDVCEPLAMCDPQSLRCRPLPQGGEPCLSFDFYRLCGPGFLCGEADVCVPPADGVPQCG